MKRTTYEPILKEPLVCFRCNSEMKNMPILKAHLQEEWDKLERRAKLGRNKRKLPEVRVVESQPVPTDEVEEPKEKRARTEEVGEAST